MVDHTKINHYEGIIMAYHLAWESRERITELLNERYTGLSDEEREKLTIARDALSDCISSLNKKRVKYREEL